MSDPLPIIFHHGFMDVFNLRMGKRGIYAFMGINRRLAEQGRAAIYTRVHPTASIAHRAAQLKEQLLNILGAYPAGTRALIVAHSMGGLDARYMISRLDMGPKIAALLTVATPHRGTPYADIAWAKLERLRISAMLNKLKLDITAVSDLTGETAEQFNQETPDDPQVRYFSISAQCELSDLPPWCRRAHRIISRSEGANDGLVSVRSAMYGEHLGTWPMSHWTLLNKQLGKSASRAVALRYSECLDLVFRRIE